MTAIVGPPASAGSARALLPAAEAAARPPALEVDDLSVAFRVRGGERQVLDHVSLRIARGESYGLVGESGCGKSTVALAVVRYLARNGRVSSGRIEVAGLDLLRIGKAELRQVRRTAMSMVYQDAGRALNPTLKVGRQVEEIFALQGLRPAECRDRTIAMLRRVQITDPGSVTERYPHQLSGGMQQRVAIAMALAINPDLLILDEPTTGLDVTVEAEILDLIARLRQEYSSAVLFISHNLGVIAKMCDRIGVLYAGRLVEEGPTRDLLEAPRHPYTVGLLRCLPRAGRRKDHGRLDTIPGTLPALGAAVPACIFVDRCGLAADLCRTVPPDLFDLGGRRSRCHFHERAADLPRTTPADASVLAPIRTTGTPVLETDGLAKTFRVGRHAVRAVSDVSITLWPGQTLGIVGESGSGKSTLARMMLGLVEPDEPERIRLNGAPLPTRLSARSADQLKTLQIVFQNPDSALNRAHSIRHIIGRALTTLAKVPRAKQLERLLTYTHAVRLADRYLASRPSQLSGGLKQRVAIARAFAGEPSVVVCDEPTSALDVSVQAAILNLLVDLQAERGVSYIFISHDLGTVRYLSDRIAVLYMGRLMEIGPAEEVFEGPHHPYTEALLSAVPELGGGTASRIRLHGEMPSAIDPPPGCVFQTRCPRKIGAICETAEPGLNPLSREHGVRCHLPADQLGRSGRAVGAAVH